MKEAFVHFIWQFQLFNKKDLTLLSGQEVNVLKPGHLNEHSGPDFSQAHIHYDDLDFYGHVEIHIKSSEWNKHKHQNDPAYNNVILHVVLENDEVVYSEAGHQIPTLELKGRIPLGLYNNFENLLKSNYEIACESQIQKISPVVLLSMLDRVLTERLEKKSDRLIDKLSDLENDWEELAFRAILSSFGFKRNSNGFTELSNRISFKDLKRYCKDLGDIEAVLFGFAGFLKGGQFKDKYRAKLSEKFNQLKKLFKGSEELDPVIWKFFRLRPANFPTLRLAQFSAFIYKKEHLLSHILELETKNDAIDFFTAEVSEYWKEHYKFSKELSKEHSEMGESSIENLIINSVIPIWVTYSRLRNMEEYLERSLKILEELNSENNKITRFWKEFDFPNYNAYDSQALIQLYDNYCMNRNCLKCNIGVTLVREY